MKNLPKKIRLLPTLIFIVVFIVVGISACNNIFGGGGEEEAPPGPETFEILAPPNDVKALVGSPIQIQSAHPNSGSLSRVELYVQRENEPTEQLVRSDTPNNGVAVQQWVPREVGLYTVRVRGIQTGDVAPSEYVRRIRVIDDAVSGVVVASVGQPPAQVEPTIVAATPAPTRDLADTTDAGAAFVVEVAADPDPTSTPIPRYPPPPPAPGVPWGPTQAELPNFHPPVCDAAEVIEGRFAVDPGRRLFVTEDDDVAAKAAAGTTIHRVWRLRNIGTCTWGPGYELAFYGGRTMGSGGVAFESSYPSDVPRRNVVIDSSRLIVPEGKPNQTAALEVLLNVPTVPGIHQSYWRMRNPHGVYFGPILGITLDVVRDCSPEDKNAPRIYGAPDIRRFVILGVGDVYEPNDPKQVLAELGEQITLEWNVINANNFDIVFEDPTGDIESLSTNDTNSRASFTPTTLGEHRITLFADNGTCTVQAQVIVVVEPPDEEQFRLDIILASSTQVSSADASASVSSDLPRNRTQLEWTHFDPDADQFFLIARGERMIAEDYCVPLTDLCYPVFSDWQETGEVRLQLGGEGGQANTATVANVERRLCPASFNPEQADHRIIYQMQAFKDSRAADPQFSNEIEVFCDPNASELPREVR